MLELSKFLRVKGEWEPKSTVVRKGSEKLPPTLSHYLSALRFPSSLISRKPRGFRHIMKFLDPLVTLKLAAKFKSEVCSRQKGRFGKLGDFVPHLFWMATCGTFFTGWAAFDEIILHEQEKRRIYTPDRKMHLVFRSVRIWKCP